MSFTEDFNDLSAWDVTCDPDSLATISATWFLDGPTSLQVDQQAFVATGGGIILRDTGESAPTGAATYSLLYTIRTDVADWAPLSAGDGSTSYLAGFILASNDPWSCGDPVFGAPSLGGFDNDSGRVYGPSFEDLGTVGEGEVLVDVEQLLEIDADQMTARYRIYIDGSEVYDTGTIPTFGAPDYVVSVSVGNRVDQELADLTYWIDSMVLTVTQDSEPEPEPEPEPVTMPSACEPFQRWWRFIVADMDGASITLFDRHARSRTISYRMNSAIQIQGEVSSADPQINIVHTDGFPYLAEGDRLLYCLRREFFPLSGLYGWVCRAAGTILQLEDGATAEDCDTTFIAYDPWQYLYALPVYNPNAPDGDRDIRYPATDIDDIIIDLLTNADTFYNTAASGSPNHTRIDYGQTIFYNGTIESLSEVDVTFSRDQSIGEALDDLCALGLVDVVLTPIYDPDNRPGYLAELSLYAVSGSEKPGAIFSWDMPGHNVVGINRNVDGTQRGNKIRFHANQRSGGEVTVTRTEPASIARFGDYFQNQFFDLTEEEVTLGSAADELLNQVSEHRKTVSLDVIPQRGPDPFREWYLGDTVQVYATSNLRATQSGFQRVISFDLDIDDDAREQVTNLTIYIPNETPLVPEPESSLQQGPIQMTVAERASWLARTVRTARRRLGGR